MAAHDVDIAPSTEERISTTMVAALEAAWSAIRQRHPEVPPVMVVVGAGSVGAPAGTLKLGHFAALRWMASDEGEGSQQIAEVFVGGEGFARGADSVLGTLLHEAAHALADVRGIKDTSRQGRWHNVKFKALAEEFGVEVTKDPRIGWSPTSVRHHARGLRRDDHDASRCPAPSPKRGAGNGGTQDEEAEQTAVRLRLRAPHPRRGNRPRARPDHMRRLRC